MVTLEGVRGEETQRVTGSSSTTGRRWLKESGHRGRGGRCPDDARRSVLTRVQAHVTDDVGGTEWRALWFFLPEPPVLAGEPRITFTLDGEPTCPQNGSLIWPQGFKVRGQFPATLTGTYGPQPWQAASQTA